jgi:hypothetical protein
VHDTQHAPCFPWSPPPTTTTAAMVIITGAMHQMAIRARALSDGPTTHTHATPPGELGSSVAICAINRDTNHHNQHHHRLTRPASHQNTRMPAPTARMHEPTRPCSYAHAHAPTRPTLSQLGSGSYSVVICAVNRDTGERVALKKLKYCSQVCASVMLPV